MKQPAMWMGKSLDEYTKEELIAIIETLGNAYFALNSPEQSKFRAVGKVEMMKV